MEAAGWTTTGKSNFYPCTPPLEFVVRQLSLDIDPGKLEFAERRTFGILQMLLFLLLLFVSVLLLFLENPSHFLAAPGEAACKFHFAIVVVVRHLITVLTKFVCK